jgi:hypothetical protein
MFDYELRVETKRVEVLVPKVDGPVAKACRITVRRDLDVDIARALAGEFGVQALKQLHDRGITKIQFPIDAISARAVIKADEGAPLEIACVTGMTAVAKAKKLQESKEPDAPQVELKFQFPWTSEAWTFLGGVACTVVGLKLTRNQLELPLASATPEGANGGGKPHGKRSKAGKKSASPPPDDPQSAASPEEAEEVRAQRMREEKAEAESAWVD